METQGILAPMHLQFMTITAWLIVEYPQRTHKYLTFVFKDRIPCPHTILPVNGDKAMFILSKQKIAEPKTSCSACKHGEM